MSARDVIANYLNKSLESPMSLTTEEHAMCIVSSLESAGYVTFKWNVRKFAEAYLHALNSNQDLSIEEALEVALQSAKEAGE